MCILSLAIQRDPVFPRAPPPLVGVNVANEPSSPESVAVNGPLVSPRGVSPPVRTW